MTDKDLKKMLDKEPLRMFFPPSVKTLESLARILNLGTTYVNRLNMQNSFKTDILCGIYKDPLFEGKSIKIDKKELGVKDDALEKEKELEESLKMKNAPGISGPSLG